MAFTDNLIARKSVQVDQNGNVINPIAQGVATIAPNDSTSIIKTLGIYVGGAGDIAVVMADGTQATFKNVSAGVVLPISVTRVKLTGTTATNLLAVY